MHANFVCKTPLLETFLADGSYSLGCFFYMKVWLGCIHVLFELLAKSKFTMHTNKHQTSNHFVVMTVLPKIFLQLYLPTTRHAFICSIHMLCWTHWTNSPVGAFVRTANTLMPFIPLHLYMCERFACSRMCLHSYNSNRFIMLPHHQCTSNTLHTFTPYHQLVLSGICKSHKYYMLFHSIETYALCERSTPLVERIRGRTETETGVQTGLMPKLMRGFRSTLPIHSK